MKRILMLILAALALPLAAASACAQGYPEKTIRMMTRSPEEFAEMVRADIVRYAKVVKAAGVHID